MGQITVNVAKVRRDVAFPAHPFRTYKSIAVLGLFATFLKSARGQI